LHDSESSTDGFHLDAAPRLDSFDFLALIVEAVLPLRDDLTVEEIVIEKAGYDENVSNEARHDKEGYYDGQSARNPMRLRSTALFAKEYDLHRSSNRTFRTWPIER
jgi:hypothetical protein